MVPRICRLVHFFLHRRGLVGCEKSELPLVRRAARRRCARPRPNSRRIASRSVFASRTSSFAIAIGLAGSIVTARLLSKFLFGIEASDPLTYALVSTLLLAIALLASFIPSRRAMRVDPLTALRAE